ncbi:DMT family transporter [Succinispira mobilis]|uniref:DMT family transporter n=1 Tax=Succinispira mobilis TaxID=78120 RepID=UPI0003730E7A|nr:DMT family transporter [Succinispira mobilis]
MNATTKGIFLATLSAIGFATLPIFVKLAYAQNISTGSILFFRFFLSSCLIFAYITYRKISLKLPREKILPILALGAIGFAICSLSFTLASKYLSASLVAIIFQIYPAIVAIIAFICGLEKITLPLLLAFASCFLGLSLVIGLDFTSLNYLGLFWALFSGISYAIYITLSNKISREIPSLVLTFYVCASATVVFLFTSSMQTGFDLSLTFSGFLTLLAMSIFSTIVGILGFIAALKYISPTHTCIVSTSEPVFTVLIAIPLLQESLTSSQVYGASLVIFSILALELKKPLKTTKKHQ